MQAQEGVRFPCKVPSGWLAFICLIELLPSCWPPSPCTPYPTFVVSSTLKISGLDLKTCLTPMLSPSSLFALSDSSSFAPSRFLPSLCVPAALANGGNISAERRPVHLDSALFLLPGHVTQLKSPVNRLLRFLFIRKSSAV